VEYGVPPLVSKYAASDSTSKPLAAVDAVSIFISRHANNCEVIEILRGQI
jgi:hypothetical protein